MKKETAKEILKNIKRDDRRALSKAITMTESSLDSDKKLSKEIITLIQKEKINSLRIGVSGITGSGKSTLIDKLGSIFIHNNKKVAVLAVDPSSPISGGSILGDKTRMEYLGNHSNAFIRPSPNKQVLGGVGHKTRECVHLCEAAGFDIIFIETVGVGQSEVQVSSMVDLFILTLLPSTGDELQGIKKGIVELADLIIINKADGELENSANITCHDYKNATDGTLPILTCSSKNEKLINELYSQINLLSKNGSHLRSDQQEKWAEELACDLLKNKIQNIKDTDSYRQIINELNNSNFSIYEAAEKILQETYKK